MASSEETPLLPENDVIAQHEAVYRRFSPAKKRAIVGMVSLCGIIPLFVTGSFTPSIAQVAKDLNTTGSTVSFAVSVSAFAAGVGGLIGGSYSTFYGRRSIYKFSLPTLVIGSLGVATATNVQSLLFWRFFQSVGASPGQVVGAGVIGDIYKLEERGRAMAFFWAISLLGPSLAPLAGGSATFYYSWRIMQGSLGVVGLIAFCIMYLFFPETSHPGTRGIDKKRAGYGPDSQDKKIGFVFINPLRPLLLLRSPNMLLISLSLSASLTSVFVLLVPLSYTIGERYNILNEAVIGACFLPAGVGNMVGAAIVGRISDRTVIYWRKKRGGVWYPEDRLRASLIPIAIIAPIPLVMFGLANQLIRGVPGLVICLICLFFNGVGVEMAFGPCAAYLVDVMHSRSAEALASNNALRLVLVAAGTAVVLPMINTLGVSVTYAIFAGTVWIGFGLICCIIRYGEQMRAWADVGFSTMENN